VLLRLLAALPISAVQRPAPTALPATLGPWILPKARDLHPMLMRDRLRGGLTRWTTALTPRLLARWEAEDRQRLNEDRYAGWEPEDAPEGLLHEGDVLLRGNAILREGRCGQARPPRPVRLRFVHRLGFVETPKGLRLDRLEEVHWGEWRQAEGAAMPR